MRTATCQGCGAEFQHRQSRVQPFCSLACSARHKRRPLAKDAHWWMTKAGYREGQIRQTNGSWRRVLEHRYVMEQHLGRRLTRGENVHHIDGDKGNNSLANLQLLNHSEHATLSGRSWTSEQRARQSDSLRRAALTRPPSSRTHCAHGHPLDEANTYVRASGFRDCRQCNRERTREYSQRRQERAQGAA